MWLKHLAGIGKIEYCHPERSRGIYLNSHPDAVGIPLGSERIVEPENKKSEARRFGHIK